MLAGPDKRLGSAWSVRALLCASDMRRSLRWSRLPCQATAFGQYFENNQSIFRLARVQQAVNHLMVPVLSRKVPE
jgi:hypothetical protein